MATIKKTSTKDSIIRTSKSTTKSKTSQTTIRLFFVPIRNQQDAAVSEDDKISDTIDNSIPQHTQSRNNSRKQKYVNELDDYEFSIANSP